MILIHFIIIFSFMAVLPFFIAELLLFTFQPGKIFGWYGKLIGRIKNEFWYNSLGGCATCFTQRISEITYYLFVKLFISLYGGWITCLLPWVPAILLNIILFVGFAAIPYFLRTKKPTQKVNMEFDDQPAAPIINNN